MTSNTLRAAGGFISARLPHGSRALIRTPIAILVVCWILFMARSVATSKGMDWATVGDYFFDERILRGLLRTLELTVIAVAVGLVLGLALATTLMSKSGMLRILARLYIYFFRGTPLLVQLVLWYNLSSLFPTLSFGIPFGPTFFSTSTNSVISPWVAAILGLGLHEAAYTAEIIRSGLISVHKGQREAAMALGLTRRMTLRLISLPQAMRVIIPPLGNQVINVVKLSSLVSVIAIADLLYSAEAIYSSNFKTIPLLLVATVWYLIVVSVLTLGQFHLERYFSRDLRPVA